MELKIMTFNLGYNIVANIPKGSEKVQVERCQKAYNGGWYNKREHLSSCTRNALQLIAGYDLIGLQEIGVGYTQVLEKNLNQFDRKANYKLVGNNVVTCYDERIMGPGVLFYESKIPFNKSAKDRRIIHAVWFERYDLIFINLHAPHNINLKYEIEQACRDMEKKINYFEPARVIMTGDFNDSSGSLLNSSIKAFGFDLKIPVNTRFETCCADKDYKYVGDYIFDSHSKPI